MRLYRVICDWFESMVILNLAQADDIANNSGPQPEGVTSQVEHAHSFTSEPELHGGWRPDPTQDWDDRTHISLRYHE